MLTANLIPTTGEVAVWKWAVAIGRRVSYVGPLVKLHKQLLSDGSRWLIFAWTGDSEATSSLGEVNDWVYF